MRQSAFSLIELLVVIVIVFVLAAIILPAIGGVRDSAQLAKNVSNLRNLGLSSHAYASDNGGKMGHVVFATVKGVVEPVYTTGNVFYHTAKGNSLAMMTSKWSDEGTVWGTTDYLTGPDIFYGPFVPAKNDTMERQQGKFLPYNSTSYVTGYVAYSRPAVGVTAAYQPYRAAIIELCNDRSDGDYGPSAPLFSDPIDGTSNGVTMVGGFTGSKVSAVRFDCSVVSFPRDKIWNTAGTENKIKALAGYIEK